MLQDNAAPPFRAETIGSLLRPRALKDAHVALARGESTPAAYAEVLDAEIDRVVKRQEELGYRGASDGEFARSSWFGFFFEGLEGFRLEPSLFRFKDSDGSEYEWPTCYAEKRIARRGPIVLSEFRRLAKHTRNATPKASMPTPSAFHFFRFSGPMDPAVYPKAAAYFDDLVEVYRAELAELAEAGCRYLQLDEVPVAMLCDPMVREQTKALGGDPDALLDGYIEVVRRILKGRPRGLTVGMHLCRGNFRGRWMAAGGYEPVAEKLFNGMPVDVFFLEYDSKRAGDFEPLRHVPPEKSVVLGLVSSKNPIMETTDALRRRIDDAARFVPIERLGLSPQCGFASVAGGNSLNEAQQWDKLKLIADTARAVWGTT